MDEDQALQLATGLDRCGVRCRLEPAGRSRYRIAVALPDERQAVWDLHGDTLEARVSRAEQLVGFVAVPVPAGTAGSALAQLIASERYEQTTSSGRSGSLADPTGSNPNLPAAGRWRWGPARVFGLLLATTLVMLLLYLLDGRH